MTFWPWKNERAEQWRIRWDEWTDSANAMLAGMTKEAAICFFKALRVYPQPKELMTIYDKTVPKVYLPYTPCLGRQLTFDSLY